MNWFNEKLLLNNILENIFLRLIQFDVVILNLNLKMFINMLCSRSLVNNNNIVL